MNFSLFFYFLEIFIVQNFNFFKSFITQYGEITNIKLLHNRNIAYVEYATHEAADAALKNVPADSKIGNCAIKVAWGRPPKPKAEPYSYNNQDLPPGYL